ncbi:hypothetical protein Zmor_012488 [Zophobas morio]|uniref:Uncharacterized protein n=1 Tax=Zophobas morio TaxID=2755281 RepID=A0AA38MDQ6_9CUCU|nr:hypothetical protein Zmor_012488 [Zophobas morio]
MTPGTIFPFFLGEVAVWRGSGWRLRERERQGDARRNRQTSAASSVHRVTSFVYPPNAVHPDDEVDNRTSVLHIHSPLPEEVTGEAPN